MSDRKVTTGSLFGAIFSSVAKRGIQSLELGEDAPEEAKKFLHDVQEAIADEDEEESPITVVSEKPVVDTTAEEVKE